MLIEFEGKKYEFRGDYQTPVVGDYLLAKNNPNRPLGPGVVKMVAALVDSGVRAIVHPIPVLHIIGGVVFEETDEVRSPMTGEWSLHPGTYGYQVMYWSHNSSLRLPTTIIRPVSMKE